MSISEERGTQGGCLSIRTISANKIIFESLVTKKELAAAFGISGSFTNKLMSDEGLPYFKIGRAVRFRISEVSEWLERRRSQKKKVDQNEEIGIKPPSISVLRT